ncbi:MAG TPA: hypothetical protein PKK15_11245 [Kouleothrix sp.]|uniref:hypothetical protein n=1 Tax=Kouleothrix sp. TaxID=2779161 RepID=UPI002C57D95F|nr:hypothetical protein [Kouleothrix sp.]
MIHRHWIRGWLLLWLCSMCTPNLAAPAATSGPAALSPRQYLPRATLFSPYLTDTLPRATYANILAMVEPSSGLPHDKLDATLLDIVPQLASTHRVPFTSTAPSAQLAARRCADVACRHSGGYGLELRYSMPQNAWGSFNIDPDAFDVSRASYLELWVKGARGGERLEVVLWSNCQAGFPGRPDSALISAGAGWARRRIPLADVRRYANLSSLCRLSIGFNDHIHPGGTIYVDDIAFVDAAGSRVPVPLDETTNVTNIGLYMASVVGALELGWQPHAEGLARLGSALTSLERLPKSHGFPHTHNHVVSLAPKRPATISDGDRCIQPGTAPPIAPDETNLFSTVDLGLLAAGLIVVRQGVAELSGRAGALLAAMDWAWLYDPAAGLMYGCRAFDGTPSTWWHYDWLAADSRLAQLIAIGAGAAPAQSWQNLRRDHEPPRCAAASEWHFEPGWDGGGLFMALMPAIFLDESGGELGASALHFVHDQICFASQRAPAWGWSATALPPFGAAYCGYGRLCDDILAPHASILAATLLTSAELAGNLQALEQLGARPPASDGLHTYDYGFRASASWRTGEVATLSLLLDQAMAFLSLANAASGNRIRALFCRDPIAQAATTQIADYAGSCG